MLTQPPMLGHISAIGRAEIILLSITAFRHEKSPVNQIKILEFPIGQSTYHPCPPLHRTNLVHGIPIKRKGKLDLFRLGGIERKSHSPVDNLGLVVHDTSLKAQEHGQTRHEPVHIA